MSLATRCTHCGTIFKVVQDQLKVSEGWVRCGRCNEVFNALPALFDLEKDAPPPRTVPAPLDTPAAAPDETHPDWSTTQAGGLASQSLLAHTDLTANDLSLPPPDTSSIEATTEFDLDTSVPVDEAPPAIDVPRTDEADALESRYLLTSSLERKATKNARRRDNGPEFADAQFPSDAMLDAEEDWASDFGPSEPALPETVEPPARASGKVTTQVAHSPALSDEGGEGDDIQTTQPSRFAEDFEPEPTALPPPSQRKGKPGTRGKDPAQKTPEFMRRAQRRAFWRHPATRGVLSLLSLLLVITLSLQVMHQFRDLLAAHSPQARELLTQWCELANCQIKPPLQLENLQVESATLVRASTEAPDRYRLSVVIHNRADVGLAWPHVDLTLTDEGGATMARRVFAPSDARWLDTADPKLDTKAGLANTGMRVPEVIPSQRSTTLQWTLRAADLQPAGYTAELFYP